MLCRSILSVSPPHQAYRMKCSVPVGPCGAARGPGGHVDVNGLWGGCVGDSSSVIDSAVRVSEKWVGGERR